MEAGLSLGDCVRWGPSPYPKRGGAPPIFGPRLSWPNGAWIKMPALGTEVDLGLRDIVFDVDPATP